MQAWGLSLFSHPRNRPPGSGTANESVGAPVNKLIPVFSHSSDGDSMPRGFGKPQPQQRRGKTSLKESQQRHDGPKRPDPEPRDVAMQAEVEALFAQFQQDNPAELALAWEAGVYNPLAGMEHRHARMLEPDEEDWLGIAKAVGWLLVDDELEAIYFTAPPPEFALAQADWYVQPNLTTFLEEPLLLREIVQVHPIPMELIRETIAQFCLQLGWTTQQRQQFILDWGEVPETEITDDDWKLLLFEIQSQVQNLA